MGIDKYYRKGVFPAMKVKSLGDDSQIWVSPDGDDDNGDGTFLNPYASLTQAMAIVTTARKIIMLMPGEYEEAASILWPSINGIEIRGVCGGVTIVGTSGEDEVFEIDPTVQTSTFVVILANLGISCPNGVDGITFDNNNVGRKILLILENVEIENDTGTDKALNVVHTEAGEAMRVYASGLKNIWEGILYIVPKNVDDRFTFDGLQLDGGITFGTATIASVTTFKDCIVKDGGGAGGQDTQILNVLGCYSLTDTTYAAAALADFAANAAEVIL